MSPRYRSISNSSKFIAYSLLAVLVLAIFSSNLLQRSFVRSVLANSVAQTLPFSQDWSNNGLITANDDWSGVAGIEGYLGQDITTATGTDPQTLLGTSALANDLTVLANQTVTTVANGDVGEFHTTSQAGAPGTNSTIALQGSGTADAPYVLLYLNTTGQTGINISYNLRDIDCTTDNSIQQVALQYRVGNSGSFTNVPAGYVADATGGPSLCTLVTPLNVALPAAVDNQALVQVRIMSTNAVSNDEWVGVDDISVTTGGGGGTPTLNINDVTQAETDAGTTTFTFTVGLTSPALVGGVTFDIATADGTAQDGNPGGEDNDYVAKSETGRTITEGNTTASFTVTVNGDATIEPNETFFVNVTNITGANAGDVQGLGTIQNDDFVITQIHDIQGSGSTSPLVSTSLTTTGIVTGLRSNGFFLQTTDVDADANPETSEGIFVFTSSAPPAAAAIGNAVNVSGTVQEFIPSADPSSPPATELVSPTVIQLSTGNPLPAPTLITAAATTQASETSNPLDSLEEYEGMRVTVASLTVTGATQGSINEPNATVISSGVFIGVVTGVARPFREQGIAISDPLPAGAPGTIPRFDENPERIRVDSDAQPGTTAIDVAAGTVITNITGPLDYAFRCYTIDPDAATPPIVGVLPGSTPATAPTADEFTVVSFNMERFFDTVNDPATSDPVLTAAAFNRRLAKASLIIRTVQRYPDVIGVEEMENLTTLQAVATQINNDAVNLDGLANPNYTAFLSEGNDVGGIDVGFLVKASRISVVDVTQFGLTDTFTNPDSSTSILNDRPPLVLRATCPRPLGGTLPFTVIVNHLRSLSGVDDTTPGSNGFATEGDRVRFKRRAQAEYLANLIQTRQVADATELIITLGDMNAFNVNDGYVDSIGTIKGTPTAASQVTLASSDLVNPDLTDLIDVLPAAQQYSYNFDENAQTLDHIILNHKALVFLTRFAYARNDSDFAVKNYESTNELRISDHDQPVAYFNLTLSPSAANGVVSGRLTDPNGAPIAGAVVNLSGTQNRKLITDTNGNYRFDGVETSGFYTVRPSRVNYSFSPAERSFSQIGNSTEAAFTGTPAGGFVNPLDTPEYYVRQHYLDFLGREPDESGFNFWSDQMLECGLDAGCLERRRINVSAAYFLSIEFQETGGLVDGLYRVSYGVRPPFAEFMPDARAVAGGVIVGRGDWAQQLAANKQAFVGAWVERAAFRAAYDGLSNDAFVDRLLGHTGVSFSQSEREALVSGLNTGGSTRAEALREIVDDERFVAAKRNKAFVMMQYFGYLRRDPDESGYAFWLNKLSEFNGNFEQAEMVKAFINSGEYRARFPR
jgi:predicted extracellular nuclease